VEATDPMTLKPSKRCRQMLLSLSASRVCLDVGVSSLKTIGFITKETAHPALASLDPPRNTVFRRSTPEGCWKVGLR